jgi:hypothetical protein
MSNKLIPALLVSALLAGCTASASGTVGANASPSAMPSGGTNTTVGGTVGGAVDSAAYFAAGRVWDYTIASSSAGQNFSGTFKIEVSDVSNGKATVKTTFNMPPAAASTNTTTVDVNNKNAFSTDPNVANSQPKSTSTESVTVPAGTYTATKYVYDTSKDGATGTVEMWIVDGVGMVKQMQTMKPAAPAGLPAGIDLTSTTKIELTKFTK